MVGTGYEGTDGLADTYNADMRDNFVIDPLIGKRQQLMLATQLCRMVLKVCDMFV